MRVKVLSFVVSILKYVIKYMEIFNFRIISNFDNNRDEAYYRLRLELLLGIGLVLTFMHSKFCFQSLKIRQEKYLTIIKFERIEL